MSDVERLAESGARLLSDAVDSLASTVTRASGLAGTVVSGAGATALDVLGTATTCLLAGTDTGNQFALFNVIAQPGQGIPPHYHENEDETIHVISGQMRAELDGQTHILGPGDTVFLKRNQVHAWFAQGDGPMTSLLIVNPAGMDHFFPEIARRADGSYPDIAEVVATSKRYGIIFV